MKLAARKTTMAIGAVAAAGVSTLFTGASAATAAPLNCGTGTLVSAGVCEQTFTANGTFTITPQMSKLEALLVGAGGNGATQTKSNNGYAAGGGGGEVKIADFSTTTTGTLGVTVGKPSAGAAAAVVGQITGGPATVTVGNGANATDDDANGGASGGSSSNSGASGGSTAATPYGAGGGAGGPADQTGHANAGVGKVVDALTLPSGSPFAGDTACYGGGGAIGNAAVAPVPADPTAVPPIAGSPGKAAIVGTFSCGGGGADATGAALVATGANTGGGGGGLAYNGTSTTPGGAGASGRIVFRWLVAPVTLTFSANGHGTAPASETIPNGTAPTKPADPTASGFTFGGWYTDATLATAADFTAPLTADTTFFAKWTAVADTSTTASGSAPTATLAATGASVNPVVPVGAGAVVLGGIALVLLAARRRRGQAE